MCRACARLIDCLMALILQCAVERVFACHVMHKNLGRVLCDLSIAIFIACLCEIFLIAWAGTTIGKRLFGISVLNRVRDKLSVSESFQRTYLIWRKAFGYGIPFVRFVRLVRLRHEVARGVALPWDCGDYDWVVESRSGNRTNESD